MPTSARGQGTGHSDNIPRVYSSRAQTIVDIGWRRLLIKIDQRRWIADLVILVWENPHTHNYVTDVNGLPLFDGHRFNTR